MKSSKDVATGQIGLDGKKVVEAVEEEVNSEDAGLLKREELATAKSALQKAIRRCDVSKAMYWAWSMSTKETGWSLWRRLNIIAVEDILDPTVIVAVAELGKQASHYGYGEYDGKRCATAAAKIMSEYTKDRSADEFCEVMDYVGKHLTDDDCKKWIADLSKVDDYVYDVHTPEGRRRKRGDVYWLEISSQVKNASPKYLRFNDFLRAKVRSGAIRDE